MLPSEKAINTRGRKALHKRMLGKSSINIKPSHKGLLHKDTHTPTGQKIPLKKIKAAEHSRNPKVRKRARFADNARHFDH